MRYLFLTLLGFFGPALLMLLLRLTWYYFREKWLRKSTDPEIINITPVHKRRVSKRFIIVWLLVSVVCTALLLWQIDDSPAPEHVYIPAHTDAQGNFVPAQTIETERPKQ